MAECENNPFTEPPSSDEVTTRISLAPNGSAAAKVCEKCGHPFVTLGLPCESCGADPPPEAPAVVIDGRYRVESEIGRGGMGIVYYASDTWLGRPVALKMIATALGQQRGSADGLHREAKALASDPQSVRGSRVCVRCL